MGKRKEIYYMVATSDGKHFKTKRPKHGSVPKREVVVDEEKDELEVALGKMKNFSNKLDLIASCGLLLFLVSIFLGLPALIVYHLVDWLLPSFIALFCAIFTALGIGNSMLKDALPQIEIKLRMMKRDR